ncbi:MAG: hypothetical protein AAGE89_08505 [Pseudomonadota bacterium]
MHNRQFRLSIKTLFVFLLLSFLHLPHANSLTADSDCREVIRHFERTFDKHAKIDSTATWYLTCLWEVQHDDYDSLGKLVELMREAYELHISDPIEHTAQIRALTEKNRELINRLKVLEERIEELTAQ